jgi:LDH2 family malate/lactate/ureidoglycolate dehydrogenase
MTHRRSGRAAQKTKHRNDTIALSSSKVHHERLRAFCRLLLLKAGLIPPHATLVADSLVEANLRGTDSHGVARLPHYLSRIAHGSIKPSPSIEFARVAPACGRVDGDHGLGQLVMQRATEEAITLGRETGAGWVAVCNSSHCGALSYFGLSLARAGMIGLVFTHVDPMVLAHGSRAPFCGTNPICLTAPGPEQRALCLDMATSITSWNRVANAALASQPIPPGWAVDQSGQETCDASAVNALYPVGEHKGSGLGLMIDVLCAFLAGAPFGPDIPKMYGDLRQQRRLGGLVGAIDISRFLPLEQFQARVRDLLGR